MLNLKKKDLLYNPKNEMPIFLKTKCPNLKNEMPKKIYL